MQKIDLTADIRAYVLMYDMKAERQLFGERKQASEPGKERKVWRLQFE